MSATPMGAAAAAHARRRVIGLESPWASIGRGAGGLVSEVPARGLLVKCFTMWYICTASGGCLCASMPDEKRRFRPDDSLGDVQKAVERAAPAASASYAMIGAIVVLGGLGYAMDVWRGTSPWGVLGGLLLGLIVGFYQL